MRPNPSPVGDQDAPYHARVYYTRETRDVAYAFHSLLLNATGAKSQHWSYDVTFSTTITLDPAAKTVPKN